MGTDGKATLVSTAYCMGLGNCCVVHLKKCNIMGLLYSGAWLAQSVKCPALDFSSGFDIRVQDPLISEFKASSRPDEGYLKTKQKPSILKCQVLTRMQSNKNSRIFMLRAKSHTTWENRSTTSYKVKYIVVIQPNSPLLENLHK